MRVLISNLLALCGLFSTPAFAEAAASCGDSKGKSFYVAQGDKGGWQDDGISQGSFTFTVNRKDEWDILYLGSDGKPSSYVATGAVVLKTQSDSSHKEFMLIASFPGRGVVDTFSLTHDAFDPKQRILLWTSNKSDAGGLGLTKMSAFLAVCD